MIIKKRIKTNSDYYMSIWENNFYIQIIKKLGSSRKCVEKLKK